MQIFGIIALLVVVAVAAWWAGNSVEKIQDEDGKPGVYKNALDSAKDAAGQLGTDTVQPSSATEAPVPTKTIDPGLGKSVAVYDGINVSEGTTVLNLAGKGLTGSLKGEIRFLSNLKELNLSNNKFTGLPAEVGQLTKLEVLNLSSNPLTGLPQELGNLKNLKVLDLRGTQYAKQDLEVIKRGLSAGTQILVD